MSRNIHTPFCEPYSAPFRRYIQRVAHISIPKSLLRHFTALERQRVRLGRIQAFIETDDPRFRTILAHYLNYLNEQVHFRRRPEAHVYSHLKADAQDFVYDIRGSHYAARAYCARSPWGCMGATADYAIWLNAHAFTPKAFLATMRALFGPIGQCPGTIILVHTAPTRRKLIRLFAANRPDSWVTHPCPPPKPHRYKYPVFPKDHRPPVRRGLSRLERLQLLFPWMTSLPPKRPLIRYPLPPNPNIHPSTSPPGDVPASANERGRASRRRGADSKLLNIKCCNTQHLRGPDDNRRRPYLKTLPQNAPPSPPFTPTRYIPRPRILYLTPTIKIPSYAVG